MSTLGKVLDRFRQHNLKLKAAKCLLFQDYVVFLGKLVSQISIAPNPSSIEVVRDWPQPASKKDVERFMGLANYHRSHIKDFAKLARPLYDLTKKNNNNFAMLHLPCGGCLFCARIHEQWDRFNEDVDDVFPLAVRQIATPVNLPTRLECKLNEQRHGPAAATNANMSACSDNTLISPIRRSLLADQNVNAVDKLPDDSCKTQTQSIDKQMVFHNKYDCRKHC